MFTLRILCKAMPWLAICLACQSFAAESVSLEVTARQLGQALEQFAEQTSHEVSIEGAVGDQPARPLSGNFTPEEALSLILEPSGLTFVKSGERAFTIKGGVVVASITVSAASRDLAYRATVGATATKTDTLLEDIPQAIQVVPLRLMQDQQVRRLGSALANVSNVQERGTFLGGYEQFAIRGFTLDNRANYFRDGRKYSNFVAPATEVLERVEVLKGPGSVLFGQADPGGIINFVTQQPPRSRETSVRLAGGDQDHQAVNANLGGAVGNKLFYRFIGATEDEDRFRDFVETDRRVLYGSLRYEISRNVSMTFHFDDLESDTVADSGLVAVGDRVVDQSLTTNYNEPWARYDSANTNVGYRLTAVLSPSWQIRQSFNAQRLDRLRIDALPVQVIDQLGTIIRRARQRDQEFNNDFADIQLIGDIQTGSVNHTLMFGAEYVDERNGVQESNDVLLPIAIFDPVHDTPKPTFEPTFRSDSETRTNAFYFQDQIAVGDDWDVIAGVRYDEYESELALANSLGTLSEKSDEDALTYRLGAVWHANRNTSIYGSYSEGFSPNLQSAITIQIFEFLDPEQSKQFEVGTKLSAFDDRFSLTIAAFDLEKSNVLRIDADQTPRLVGVQGHSGIEMDAAGEITPGWTLMGSFAWLDAEIEQDVRFEGNTPQNIADAMGGLWTSYSFQDTLRGLRLSLGLRVVGERNGDDAQSFQLPGYQRLDFGLGYRLTLGRGELDFNAKLENLADEDYYLGAINRNQITPGEPRRFIGSLQYRF